MTAEFFDVEMQKMIHNNTANVNERNRRANPLTVAANMFNFESIPSIDLLKIITNVSPIHRNGAKIYPELENDSYHVAINILHDSLPKQPPYTNDQFDIDDIESQIICYENMSCKENIRLILKQENNKK